MRKLLQILLPAALGLIDISSHTETCASNQDQSQAGASLLQARSSRFRQQSLLVRSEQIPVGLLDMSHESHARKQVPAGTARATLPPHLFQIGMQVLYTEEMLDAVVGNSVVQEHYYAGVAMTVRMVHGDAVDPVDFYGISTLSQTVAETGADKTGSGIMNMLDIGGNYGRISISTYKNFPGRMRIVTVEPMPTTYFLLRWNLWLNSVPELSLEEFYANPQKPGVLPLNNGIENVDGKTTGFCYTPPLTMGARICNCSNGWLHLPGEHCEYVVSRSVETLVKMFNVPELAFVKMDCEGCELDVIPALMNLQNTGAIRILRAAGELHAMPNEFENWACTADGGKWFVTLCLNGHRPSMPTQERCALGPDRQSCAKLTYDKLRTERPPPTEWG